jgi:hypothetical protein
MVAGASYSTSASACIGGSYRPPRHGNRFVLVMFPSQSGNDIEMRIGVFDFHRVVAGARCDEKV